MLSPCDFAVLDLETTGLAPGYHHRIVEIAVVHVAQTGEISDEWCSLINPRRHICATEVHGITAQDLFDAPTFEDIAGDLVERLRGKIVVAHNLPFDASFLQAEFARMGVTVPISPEQGLCTMRLASTYLNARRRSLEACCEAIGYRLLNGHCALDDARAAAHLLMHYLHSIPAFARHLSTALPAWLSLNWPDLPSYGVAPVVRLGNGVRHREHFLGKLASRAEFSTDLSHAESYFSVLDRALIDRHISLHEEAELLSTAANLGLSREEAVSCHREYLRALAHLAREDAVVTSEELEDLHKVAKLLGVDSNEIDQIVSQDLPVSSHPAVGEFTLSKGDAIVFTGEEPGIERSELQEEAGRAGLVVKSSVSKKVSIVVASDADSLSGKAQKARGLGIPIVSYECYRNLLRHL